MDVSDKDSITSTSASTDVGDPFTHPGISLPAITTTSSLKFDIDFLKIKEQFQESEQLSGNSIPNVSSGLPIGEPGKDTSHHITVENSIHGSSVTKFPPQIVGTIQSEEPEADKVDVTDPCDEAKSFNTNILEIAPDRAVDKCDKSAPESFGSDYEDLEGNVTVEMVHEITDAEPDHSVDVEKILKMSSGSQTNEQDDKEISMCTDSSSLNEVETAPMGHIEGSGLLKYETKEGQCDSAVDELSGRSLGLEEKVPSFFRETVDKSEDNINSNTFQHMEQLPAEGQLSAPPLQLVEEKPSAPSPQPAEEQLLAPSPQPEEDQLLAPSPQPEEEQLLAPSLQPVESEVLDAVVDQNLNPQIMDKQGYSVDPIEDGVKQEFLLGKSIEDPTSFEHGELLPNESKDLPSSLIDVSTEKIGVVVTVPVEGCSNLPALEHEPLKAPETEAQHLESLETNLKLVSQCTDGPGEPKHGSIEGSRLCSEDLISEISKEANKVYSNDVDKMDADVKRDNVEGDSAHMKGQKVHKTFGRKKYVGEVIGYDASTGWFKVLYEDGDEEDLERKELDAILVSSDSTPQMLSRKRPLGSVVSKGKAEGSKARKYTSASTPKGGGKSTPKSLKKSAQKKKSGSSGTSRPRTNPPPTSASKRKQKLGSAVSVKSEKSSHRVFSTPASKRKEKRHRTQSIKKPSVSSHEVSSKKHSVKSVAEDQKSKHTPKKLKFGAVKVVPKKQGRVKDVSKQEIAEDGKNSEATVTPIAEVRTSGRGRRIANDPSSSKGQKPKRQTRAEDAKISEAGDTPVTEVTSRRGRKPAIDLNSSTAEKAKKQKKVESDKNSGTPLTEVRSTRRGKKSANDPNSGIGQMAKKPNRIESGKGSAAAADTPVTEVRSSRRGRTPANDSNSSIAQKAKKQKRAASDKTSEATDTLLTEVRTSRRGRKPSKDPKSGVGSDKKSSAEDTPVTEVKTSRRGRNPVNAKISEETDTPITEVRTSRRGTKTANDPNSGTSQKDKKLKRVESEKNSEAADTPVTEARTTRRGSKPANNPSTGNEQKVKKRKRVESDKISEALDSPITEVRTSRRGTKTVSDPNSSLSQKPKEKESGVGKDGKTELIGKKVKKNFGGRIYSGEVVGYTKFYKVLYEDGDREDLTWTELEPILVGADSGSKPVGRKR